MWQSETFDNGRDFDRRQPSQPAVDKTPEMYNPAPKGVRNDKAFSVAALVLRIAQILFALIALIVMGTDKETITTLYESYYGFFAEDKTINFTSVHAFVGLLSFNCIVCFYAVVQLVQGFVNMGSKGSFVSSATTGFSIITFALDTVLAYGLIGASAAGADSAAYIHEAGYCDALAKFCRSAQASVAMSFFAFFFLAVSSALYPFRLFTLTKG